MWPQVKSFPAMRVYACHQHDPKLLSQSGKCRCVFSFQESYRMATAILLLRREKTATGAGFANLRGARPLQFTYWLLWVSAHFVGGIS